MESPPPAPPPTLGPVSLVLHPQAPTMKKLAPQKAVTIAVIREGLEVLQSKVSELVSISPGDTSSLTAVSESSQTGMNVADVRAAIAALGEECAVSPPRDDRGKETGKRRRDGEEIYTIQNPEQVYPIRLCPHCDPTCVLGCASLFTTLQSRLTDLSIRGLALVRSKAEIARAMWALQRRAKTQERKLRRVERERDQAVKELEDARENMKPPTWIDAEILTLRAQIQELEAENARLAKVEADCEASAKTRAAQDRHEEQKRETSAWVSSEMWDQILHRMQEMERRNAYLEFRLSLSEEERVRTHGDASSSSGCLVHNPRSVFGGRGLSLSLRGPRRRVDVEEGTNEGETRR